MSLPTDPKERKNTPITSGVLDYFPDALAEVARVSKAGNDQHNPGQPLHWAWGKSNDHADCITRHLMERGSRDTDGMRHSAKLAWRALALLQEELVSAGEAEIPRGARVAVQAPTPEPIKWLCPGCGSTTPWRGATPDEVAGEDGSGPCCDSDHCYKVMRRR